MTEIGAGIARGDLNPWWRFGVPLVVALERALFRVRVTGIHRVPLSGPAILAP
jgi:1-acyl-sn-glycerol-3-phosphate acyltransferase